MKVIACALAAAALLGGCRERGGRTEPRPAPPARASAPTPAPGFLDESGQGPPRDGGVLERRLVGEPPTLNAVLQTGLPEQQVLQCLSRNLFDFDARMNLVPGLAASLAVSSDGRDYEIALRPEAVWDDGSPVEAEDAVFTIRRIVDPDVASPVFKPLFDDLASVETTGKKSFRVRFRKPYAYRSFAFVLPLLPARSYARKPFGRAAANRAPLSNGPYRFVSWKGQESITLERNQRYWGPRPHFDRVVFRIVPDNSVSYRGLLAGDLDETWIDSGLKKKAAADPRFLACCRVVEFYNLDYNYIALNNRAPFFSDARVRRALTMLLDRDSIVRNLYDGSARVISGPWAPDSPAYDAALAPLPFDPPGSAALLAEAGWRDRDGDGIRDRDGVEFRFELLVSSGSTAGRQIDELLAAELARVGVIAQVRPLEWAAFVERIDSGHFDAASLAWSASDPNPDPYPYWHSSQWPPQGLNSGYYRNPAADTIMEKARTEPDEGRRMAAYHRLHALLRDDAPAIFVVNASEKYAFRRRIRGLVTSPLGLFGSWPGPNGWWAAPDDPAAGKP